MLYIVAMVFGEQLLLVYSATTSAPESTFTGLFYGGGFDLLIKQLTGIVSVGIWTAITITITFFIIKKIFGLRVSEREEIIGLDIEEHGCEVSQNILKNNFLRVIN